VELKRSRGGKREDLGSIYFRSTWEANIARYFQWLKEHGEIQNWEFEPCEFEFLKIKRGTRYYIPDFRVVEKNGFVTYYEVKGYMDSISATKLKRMALYFPEVKIKIIDRDAYNGIKSTMKYIINGWEK
jgi:hypothetical protein